MRLFRKFRAALQFVRDSHWIHETEWKPTDAEALAKFLTTDSGRKLSQILLNFTLRQQAQAISASNRLEYEVGYCNGIKGAILFIQSLTPAGELITDSGDQTPTADE